MTEPIKIEIWQSDVTHGWFWEAGVSGVMCQNGKSYKNKGSALRDAKRWAESLKERTTTFKVDK